LEEDPRTDCSRKELEITEEDIVDAVIFLLDDEDHSDSMSFLQLNVVFFPCFCGN
jgi:hypothetical protein